MNYDVEKVNCLRQQISKYRKQLIGEKDYNKRKELELKMKICDLKIMVVKIEGIKD